MDFIKKILDFLTQILLKLIPGRKEKAIEQYRKINLDIEERQRKREVRRNAEKTAKAILDPYDPDDRSPD